MAVKKFATQENLQALTDELKTRVVTQEPGKGLSTNDLTAELLAKINAAQNQEQVSAAIAEAIASVDHLKRKIVASTEAVDLAAEDADHYIYLVGTDETGYDEYMIIDGKLDKVGNWKTDLSGYATTEYVNAELGKCIKNADMQAMTTEEVAALFSNWN